MTDELIQRYTSEFMEILQAGLRSRDGKSKDFLSVWDQARKALEMWIYDCGKGEKIRFHGGYCMSRSGINPNDSIFKVYPPRAESLKKALCRAVEQAERYGLSLMWLDFTVRPTNSGVEVMGTGIAEEKE